MLKANNRCTQKRFEICLKSTIKTPERCQWPYVTPLPNFSIIDFEQVNSTWNVTSLNMTLHVSKIKKSWKYKISRNFWKVHIIKEVTEPNHEIFFKFDICFDFCGSKSPLGDGFWLWKEKKMKLYNICITVEILSFLKSNRFIDPFKFELY